MSGASEGGLPPADPGELRRLVDRLADAEAALAAAMPGKVDAVVHPSGQSYLLRDAQQALLQSEARTREQAAFLEALLTSAPDYVAHVALDGTILFVNRGLPPLGREGFVGTPWISHTPAEHRASLQEAFDAVVATGTAREHEGFGYGPHGSVVWYSRRLGPVRLGDSVVGVVVITRDVTDRDERIRLTERQRRLEAANEELDAFAYSVSHDLRAPLRAIDGFSRAISEDCAGQLSDTARDHLARIGRNVERMQELIEALLSFSRLAGTVPESRPVNMRALAASVLEDRLASERERKIEIELQELPEAPGDPDLLRQVWDNLIANAIKYTRRRDRALVRVSGRVMDQELIYTVEDNGAGFDMKYAGRLFGVFQRLHADADFEGVGVGLSLVRRIIARHGGRVWASATPDVGATFSFALPK